MRRIIFLLFFAALGACQPREVLPPWEARQPDIDLKEAESERLRSEPISILPRPQNLDPRHVKLGGRLFFDPRFSSDGKVACATCHDVSSGGGDGRKFSLGVEKKQGGINAPTVLNASLNVAQFWDGRAHTLEEQAAGPVSNPMEMDFSLDRALEVARRDPYYMKAFADGFKDGLTVANFLEAIATYERSLITANSRFDQWLSGDDDAITAEEHEGYLLFKSVGCIACHQGRNVGGNMFQKFGVLQDYFDKIGKVAKADLGRFNVTGQQEDRFVFKVPSLRVAALTAPYFHNGSADTLEEAVRIMGAFSSRAS